MAYHQQQQQRASHGPQLIFLFAVCSVLTHALGQIQSISAAGTSSSSETTSSSQPLWSYQVKPNSYINAPVGGIGAGGGGGLVGQSGGHYGQPPSIFDAFNGLSQRQGALTSSPFLSILPIILIAAGGLLLLLPMLTMMMASPFGGGGGGPFGGYNNGAFGYPQVGALSKKRSLAADQANVGQRSLIDILESVSSTIEDLSRKYANNKPAINGNLAAAAAAQHQKRAKSLNELSAGVADPSPSNHKPSSSPMDDSNSGGGGGGASVAASSGTTS